ncbi:hypothetical protein T265_05095 [Opisthorchis viverrini]|uniref:UDP-N-acetylglucosamine transferase subunit ALG13 n=2 Tax=Opisthorchis viverrini TaxID=6198 RepID=A0A074ZQ71_OPIVI|nr:hypothetical protein T265_05095 [Opisthorchis viverrini]KER27972.1 hypothetical protein T265_05095 [Opisthorchis viverrini]
MASVFVTVGTTLFDQLVEVTNEPLFHAALWILGYRYLVVQYGRGTTIPCAPSDESVQKAVVELGWPVSEAYPLELSMFRYKPSIQMEIDAASLVISHGGAGTCVQALTPTGSRRLIVVINDTLLGNHQEELAFTLARGRHAVVTTPTDLTTLLLKGTSAIYPSDAQSFYEFSPDVKQFLGPSVPPEQAGFVGFHRGHPERLLAYLDERLTVLR